jgi:endonuclease-3
MPTTTNKQRVLTHLFTSLKKRYDPGEPEPRPVLEQLLYAILREGTTRELADRAYRNLQDRFFDWNEIRVSSIREVEEAIGHLPQAEARAQRVISLLQEVFETTFSFDLESLHKKGLKKAANQLSRYEAIKGNDFAVAWVMQRALGGHSVPVDGPTLRALRRLGLIDGEQQDIETIRSSIEHLIPKARGPLFNELMSFLASEYCWEEDPNCAACPLAHDCPTAREAAREPVAAERSRPKPR